MATFKTYRFNYIFVFCLVLFTFSFMSFFTTDASAATQVTLEWSPNTEPDLSGYKVFAREEGQSYDYANPSWEGTEPTAIIYNIDETKTNYFVARAFDTEGYESGDSNEVSLVAVVNPGLVQEAENGILYGAFVTASDSAASNGQYVHVPNGAGSRGDAPDEAHKVEFSFNVIETGTYQIKAWVHAANTADDSFWVKVDGSPAQGYLWDVLLNTSYQSDYVVDRGNADYVSDRSNSNLVKVTLAAGVHVITIYLREDGTRLDKIELEPVEGNQPPVANAGPDQTAGAGQLVTLNGSNSTDPDDGIASYRWVQTGGSPVTLSDSNGQQATFTAPDIGTEGASLTFALTVVDYSGLENTDTCVVNVTWLNAPPTAQAGPDQTADEGQVITLNGSNSTDPDDGIASYRWVQTGGSPVTLSDPSGQQTTFTAPDVGTGGASLTFALTVVDHGGLENTDVCVVNVTWQNEPPSADAGIDQTVGEGGVVTLDGTASLDIDDGIAAYSWIQTGGPVVILSDAGSPQPTFTAPNVGPEGASLTFNLTVTDMAGLQDTDSSIVNISWQNTPPTAVVAQEYIEVDPGTTVTLDGSGSIDTDDGIVSYQWTQVGGTPVSLSAPGSSVTTFTAPETDQYGSNLAFKLTVTDAGGLQGTVDCSVYVVPSASAPPAPVNNPPVADFGYFESRLKVTFMDRSIDSDGTIVSWLWDFGDGTTSTVQNPRHRYSRNGIYTVTLTVTDDGRIGGSISKTVTVSK